jgi:hypothetical protein
MLFKQHILAGISEGRITVAFRRWKRPTVKAGGTLKTPVGILAIESVKIVDATSVTPQEVEQSGFTSRDELLTSLGNRSEQLHRVRFRRAGADPRIALRQNEKLTSDELAELQSRLRRLDSYSKAGPWTSKVLNLIADFPETRAADLASRIQCEKMWLKTNIRKSKNLGLTESLKVSYRLSPRGVAFLGTSNRQSD